MHSPHQRGHRIAALTLSMAYAAILLTGCTSLPSASPSTTTPTSSTSSSGTASPTTMSSPSPTVSLDIPAAAKEKSIKGGIEFAKWFTEKLSLSFSDLESDWVASVAQPSCGACAALVSDIRDLKSRGEHVSIRRFKFIATQVTSSENLPTFTVEVVGDELKADILRSSGAVVEHLAPERSWLRYEVTWTSDGWRIRSLVAVKP